ncbi:hypothetical protein KJ359_004318 [Pestalotiopsis sp. 9143b]|nr:hypothetical protein KJ359_004318 [Pestalotiopsis sp. 9143b]
MGLSRHFALLKSRLMVDLQTKLSSMEKTIQKPDQDDAQNDPERLKKLPFDPNHLFHACYDTWMKYSSLISMSQRMDENSKASSFSYENFRDFVRSDLPDGEAWDALVGEEHDFIRTRTSPLDKELEWLRWLLDDLHAFILVLSCSLFVLFVVIARMRNFTSAFVAFSTYTAVLVTSLSNLYQARAH